MERFLFRGKILPKTPSAWHKGLGSLLILSVRRRSKRRRRSRYWAGLGHGGHGILPRRLPACQVPAEEKAEGEAKPDSPKDAKPEAHAAHAAHRAHRPPSQEVIFQRPLERMELIIQHLFFCCWMMLDVLDVDLRDQM